MQGQVGGQERDRSEQLGFTSQGCPTRPTGFPSYIQLVRFASQVLFTKDYHTYFQKQAEAQNKRQGH